jgi:regulator of replication initiation timing
MTLKQVDCEYVIELLVEENTALLQELNFLRETLDNKIEEKIRAGVLQVSYYNKDTGDSGIVKACITH